MKALEGEVKKVKEHEEHYMYKVGKIKLYRFFLENKKLGQLYSHSACRRRSGRIGV